MRAEPDGCRPPPPGEAWTLERIVADYKERKRPNLARFLKFYAIQRSLADAIELAAYAKTPSGKKHPHQRRLPRVASERAHVALRSSESEIGGCRTFAELHAAIERAIRGIDKIGVLMVYDAALRLGAFLKLEPEVVYVHAGTREGAAALGIDRSRETVGPDEVPAPFRALRPHEIEDCLCIYKEQIAGCRRA